MMCDHTSVGMIIWKDSHILLLERKRPPYGFAPPAGHVDKKESYENAAKIELKEEVGLTATNLKLLFEGRRENHCRRIDGTWHKWKIYEVEVTGEITPSHSETKQVRWFNLQELKVLAERTVRYRKQEIKEDEWINSPGLEPVWEEFLRELKILV